MLADNTIDVALRNGYGNGEHLGIRVVELIPPGIFFHIRPHAARQLLQLDIAEAAFCDLIGTGR